MTIKDNSIEGEVDRDYFEWLFSLLEDRQYDFDLWSYYKVMRYLYNVEFTWSVEHDENRAADGLMLRRRFAEEYASKTHLRENDILYSFETEGRSGCSVLEMMIGLAIRIDDATVGIEEPSKIGYWFYIFLQNLGLDKYIDRKFDKRKVANIVDCLVYRGYDEYGRGGLFPLSPQNTQIPEQNKKELWYQMQNFVIQKFSQ